MCDLLILEQTLGSLGVQEVTRLVEGKRAKVYGGHETLVLPVLMLLQIRICTVIYWPGIRTDQVLRKLLLLPVVIIFQHATGCHPC